MRLRILAPGLVILVLLVSSCKKDEAVALMPVTTDSELALEYYETAMLAFDQLKIGMASHNLEMAVKEDSDFFMAYFWMYFMSGKNPKKIVENAMQANAELNDGETEVKTAFKYLIDGQNKKVVEHLNKAIDLYPSDPHIYKILYILQFQYLKDLEGAVETISRAIEVQPGYALAYNQLGYAFMHLEEFGKAEEAFDKYIKMAPTLANPYDSKGDFYMTTEQYDKAFVSYMKAYEIDSGFSVSEKKARKAKYLQEKLEE